MEQEECQEVHLGVEARRVKVLPLRKWTKSLNLDLICVDFLTCNFQAAVIVFCIFLYQIVQFLNNLANGGDVPLLWHLKWMNRLLQD